MREAYRLEKSLIQSKEDYSRDSRAGEMLCIVFLYMGRKKTLPDLETFREEIRVLIGNIILS